MFRLETERTLLRELTVADAAQFFALNADPEVIRYTGDSAFDSVSQASGFLGNYTDYVENGFGRWAVICKESGDFLGWNGLKYGTDGTDIGFRFFRKYWNKGYATETSAVIIAYGFTELKLKRIVGRAMEANFASVRVLEKAGLSYVKPIDFEGEKGLLYEILNPHLNEGPRLCQ